MTSGTSNTELFMTPQEELGFYIDRLIRKTDNEIAEDLAYVDALARARMARESDETVVGNIGSVKDLDGYSE